METQKVTFVIHDNTGDVPNSTFVVDGIQLVGQSDLLTDLYMIDTLSIRQRGFGIAAHQTWDQNKINALANVHHYVYNNRLYAVVDKHINDSSPDIIIEYLRSFTNKGSAMTCLKSCGISMAHDIELTLMDG